MKRNVLGILLAGAIGAALITGCGAASSGTARSSAPQQTQESAPEDGDAGKSASLAIPTDDTKKLTDIILTAGIPSRIICSEASNNIRILSGINSREIRTTIMIITA